MCVLCADLTQDLHWSEQSPEAPRRADAEASRRLARARRVRLVNQVLAPQLAVHEDLSGTRYVVDNRKGAQEVVRDLPELWAAAEMLTHRRLDPLDEGVLGRLEGGSR